jgi:hypothetical protein
MRHVRRILAFAASISLLLPGVSARPLPAGDCASDKYSVVLDTVFPVDWDECKGSSPLSFGTPQITIRILPSFSQESQIFICGVDAEPGKFFVVSSMLDPKDKTAWSHMMTTRKIDDRTSEGVEATESSEEIAAVIHVIHKSCKLNSRIVSDWFRRLAAVRMSLPLLGGGIDGTTYELTLRHGGDLMQAKIWVGDAKQQKPLITLVGNIYREIERADCTLVQHIPKRA